MNETVNNNKSARKVFSLIGIALSVFLVVGNTLQILLPEIVTLIFGEDNWLNSSSWGMWIGTFAPLFLIAYPITILILRKIPAVKTETNKLSTGKLLSFIPMCFCVSIIGNLLGTILSSLLSGGQATNAVESIATDEDPLKKILFVVILAPIVEELIFRKLIIDRTHQYGEKTAVLLSGLLFGLFHTNLYQFFYTFVWGMLFAYVYIRTKKLIYPILLHAFLNFWSSIIGAWALSNVDLDALSNISTTSMQAEQLMETLQPILPGLLILMLYLCVQYGLAIWGLVLLIIRCKKAQWQEAEAQLPKGTTLKTVYLNVGMILFIVISVALTIFVLLI